MTDTLYDLLGALPRDDAEDLRTAFRKAVKGAHPDLNPEDPDAARKFRQIVRANEILSDDEQRAAYDHLLDLAHIEQQSSSRRTVAARIHKLASGALAVVGLLALTVGSYLLFMHISVASVSTLDRLEIGNLSSGDIPAEEPGDIASRNAASNAAPMADMAVATPACLRSPDVYVDRNAILQGAFAALDRAIEPSLKFTAAYIDRNIIFYRQRKSDALADLAQPKPFDKAGRSKLPVTPARHDAPREEARAGPFFSRRITERDPSRQGGF